MDINEAYSSYETHGVSLIGFAKAFRTYPTVLEKYFVRFLGVQPDSEALATLSTQWVPVAKWLPAIHAIVEEVGGSTIYSVGKRISEVAPLPPEIDSAAAVLSAIDVTYHFHHRRDGIVMFDGATGTMLEGIGHYRCELQEGGSAATITVDIPYPCDLDRGLIAGFAARFEPAVSVTHVGTACRKNGDPACTYLVQW